MQILRNAITVKNKKKKKRVIWEINREPQGASAMIWLESTANGGELKGNHWEYADNNVAWQSIIHNYGSFSTSHNTLSNAHHSNKLQQNADLSLK